MAKLLIVDEKGASAADLEGARDRFDEANIDAFGANLDTASHAPQNQIAGINSLLWVEVGEELLRAALWGASPSYARGVFLDSLGGLFDIRRIQESRTKVEATITGTTGTTVPSGSLARTDIGDQFQLISETVIQSGGTKAVFESVNPGPIPCAAGDLNNIVSVISGWTAITNDANGLLGRERESDSEYRNNLLTRTAQSSIGSIAGLRSAAASAGAVNTKVIENNTGSSVLTGGVTIPRNSILVVAQGGLDDDIARAIQNHRAMGVGILTAIVGDATTLSQVQTIRNGRMTLDGTAISGLDFNGNTLSQVADELTNASSASYATTANRIAAFYSWDSESTGFEDYEGSLARSAHIRPRFVAKEATVDGTQLRAVWDEPIVTPGGGANALAITYNLNGTPTTHDGGAISHFKVFTNIVLDNAIPANATDVKISLPHHRNLLEIQSESTQVDLDEVNPGSNAPPESVRVYGEPIAGGVKVWGYCFGTVTKWQYRRFENAAYMDSDWVDIPSSASITLTGAGNVGVSITGFTNGLHGSKVDLRAVNDTHGSTASESIIFSPSNTPPTVNDASIDGRSIELTLSQPLITARDRTGLSNWNISKAGVSVERQTTVGNKVYLYTNTQVTPTDTNLTISYSASGSNQVQNYSGVNMAAFTNQTLVNNTTSGVPGAPNPVVLTETAAGWNVQWESNYDGGLTTDRYEYQTSFNGGASWGDWNSMGKPSEQATYKYRSFSSQTPTPELVRVRGSNPNARTATILGLTGKSALPYMRPVAHPLDVSITLTASSDLDATDIDNIKQALIEKVNSYDIGDPLRVADLESEVERLPGVEIQTITITSNGVNVDGVIQNTYNQWTLALTDIDIEFA